MVDVCADFNVVGGAAAVVFCCLQKTQIHRILPCFNSIGQGGVFKLPHFKLKIQRNKTVCHIPYLYSTYFQFNFLGTSHFGTFSLQM